MSHHFVIYMELSLLQKYFKPFLFSSLKRVKTGNHVKNEIIYPVLQNEIIIKLNQLFFNICFLKILLGLNGMELNSDTVLWVTSSNC